MIPANELTADELSAWRGMVRRNLNLQSPFFQPEFSLAVGHVCDQAHIIIVESAGQPVAFLPVQKRRGEFTGIGGSVNDSQGIVSAPGMQHDPRLILKAAGVGRLYCSKLLDWSGGFGPHTIATSASPCAEISGGYEDWAGQLPETGASELRQLKRKERKLQRECGAIRFEYHTDAADVLDQLVLWKRLQYERTGIRDVFADGWPLRLLRHLLLSHDSGDLQPVMTTLHAGEHLVSAHLGLASAGILHWWFPGYDLTYRRYSPGKLLLLRLIEDASRRGIVTLDFGPGDESYKYAFSNGQTVTSRVLLDSSPVRRWGRKTWYHLRARVRQSPAGERLKAIRCRVRRFVTNIARAAPLSQESEPIEVDNGSAASGGSRPPSVESFRQLSLSGEENRR